MKNTVCYNGDRRRAKIRPSHARLIDQDRTYNMKDHEAGGQALESELEAQLVQENKPPPKSRLARFRRKGSKLLHSKHVLMAVVVLNLVDCILVLGELILDIHYVKDVLEKSDISSQKFINQMESKYPAILYDHDIDNMHTLYSKIYDAECYFNITKITERRRRSSGIVGENRSEVTVHDNSVVEKVKNARAYSIWEKVAHGLHKTSIAILGVLFIENLLKIFCSGVEFLSHKLEVFDACIVLISFTLDLVFLKGLTVYRIQDGIFILSFLVPWRVIRVVNSLIVAVLDHEHFRLKLLYVRNKKISQELDGLKTNERRFDAHIQKIEKFMEAEGIPRWKILQHTHFNKKQSTLVSMASLTMGGILNGFLEKNAFKSPIDNADVTKNDVKNTTLDDVDVKTETNVTSNDVNRL